MKDQQVSKIGPLVLGSFGIMKSMMYYLVEIEKYTGHLAFSEIWQISWMKSARFHGLPLNAKYPVYFCIGTKTKSVYFMKSGGFHEIW